MTPSQHLDCFGQVAVTSEGSMVMPVGADQICQHFGVTGIGLSARQVVPVPVTRHRHRVDPIHLIPRRHQRFDPQPPVGLDPDHHLTRFINNPRHQVVEPPNPFQAFREPPTRQPAPRFIHHMDIMVSLRPIVTYKDHRLSLRRLFSSRRAPGGDLMDQCSTARHPMSATGNPHQPAGARSSSRNRRSRRVQCSPAGGSAPA